MIIGSKVQSAVPASSFALAGEPQAKPPPLEDLVASAKIRLSGDARHKMF